MKIAIYSGSGAVLASWVTRTLKKLKISYKKLDEFDIKQGLNVCSVLIVPGGYTPLAVAALTKNYEKIRNWVAKGGKYIGICMGTYLAASEVEISYLGLKPEGLGIINISNERGEGKGIRKIKIVKHKITQGYDEEAEVYCENPPLMIPKKDVKVLAKYANNYAAWVTSTYGKGKVILFSFHPEKKGYTIKMLKNAVLY